LPKSHPTTKDITKKKGMVFFSLLFFANLCQPHSTAKNTHTFFFFLNVCFTFGSPLSFWDGRSFLLYSEPKNKTHNLL